MANPMHLIPAIATDILYGRMKKDYIYAQQHREQNMFSVGPFIPTALLRTSGENHVVLRTTFM
jgi:hypothetical protein